MIFISSACAKKRRIGDAIAEIVSYGFRHIELTGGTEYYPHIEDELRELKERYALTYLVHNYFPPSTVPFVLNLASANPDVVAASLENIREALRLSQLFGATKYSFHAGFLVDIQAEHVGKSMAKDLLCDEDVALRRFCHGVQTVQEMAGDIRIYIENNVIAQHNFETYDRRNPALMTDHAGFLRLKRVIDFHCLLDVAHLKVSATVLGHDFEHELALMMPGTEYLHISDNDGWADQNQPLCLESALWSTLQQYDLKDKTISLEIYSGMKDVVRSYELLSGL